MLIDVSKLNKVYRTREGADIHALSNVNFQIREGEFITVVGPSGCGKSTLLKILAGILRRTSGDVHLGGSPIDGPSRDVGVVFQAPVLLPWRTVIENVMLPVEIQSRDRAQYLERARYYLKLVGLENFENQYPNELSGGMQQRVAICRALLLDPALLLMDEPFGALDGLARERLGFALQRIWQDTRNAVLLVTHSITEAVLLADRVVVMAPRPGTITGIVAVDLPRPRTSAALADPRFVALCAKVRQVLEGA